VVKVVSVPSPVAVWDVVDEFGVVFWKNIPAESVVECVNGLGAGFFHPVPSSDAVHGQKVKVQW
jgi:hypothetical protein